ncbi:hypothetical protein MHFGQ_22170 [Moorella humiferrea]|uniref:Uncharacterized protein n=1 Tax=Neomoorella humiferrea TaxID=676965 RepID=A0A2T0ALT3_9FIRM|nr:hypothetical protein MOHU_22480 [Moorella humiferrea]
MEKEVITNKWTMEVAVETQPEKVLVNTRKQILKIV